MNKEKPVICLTADTQVFSDCARMMATSDPWITLGLNEEQCLQAFEGPLKEIYAARIGNTLAGFVILQTTGTFKGYIQTICVAKDYRGKGLGKELLRFCEQRILKISPNVFICVSSFNQGALKLYDALGFRLVGELENFVKEGFTELLLRKSVGPITGYQPNEDITGT